MISTNITKEKDRVPLKEKLAYGIAGPVDILSVWVLVAVAHNVFNMELLLTLSLIHISEPTRPY